MNGKTVIVAMSGGVDSSVAAGLLLEQGFNVVGATLIFRPCDDEENVSWCCGRGAQENARAVCQTLGIKHYSIDCAAEFEQEVLRPSWDSYASGRTPSPCIDCNSKIKFRILLDYAHKLGADFIATGHYAVIEHGDTPTLTRGQYRKKDQTYFLFSLDKEQLNSTLFPLGSLTKQEVREHARRLGFINAERPESQDACFVTSEGNFAEALRMRFSAPLSEGDILSPDGAVLGRHSGIHNYTIGQRKGLGIALGQKAYVTRIDGENDTVVLSKDESDLFCTRLVAGELGWTGSVVPDLPLKCKAQIRYKSPPCDAVATVDERGKLQVSFETPQKAVAPGQAVVLYVEDRVVGGAWIEKGER